MTTSLPSIDALSDTASQPDEQLMTIPKTSAAVQQLNGATSTNLGPVHHMAEPDMAVHQSTEQTNIDPKAKISNLLKDKEREWSAAVRDRPLRLLDLPMDVLKEIIKEVTHTNDLTALALTHSALHNLAIPHIYSRFDIVWPDAHATSDPRTGVDALTYGLATLCMGNVFVGPRPEHSFTCGQCGTSSVVECNHGYATGLRSGKTRLGNTYPQFTRKFSLGNGPPDWVTEYLITKESGKMLGTLVALAVARMVNLETFVWDMPTGVLRDVWLALSSLQNRGANQECRLERVWVRWHDNSDQAGLPPGPSGNPPTTTSQTLAGGVLTSVGWVLPPTPTQATNQHNLPAGGAYAHNRVEYPTLSVLPPLKSLSVLDIDEVDYLDEMSVLIAKSKDCLRELRVGISAKAVNRDFVIAWDGAGLQQVDHKADWPGASTIGDRRLGGVMGVLLGRIFDIRRKQSTKSEKKDFSTSMASSTPIPTDPLISEIQAEDIGATAATVSQLAQNQGQNNPLGHVSFDLSPIGPQPSGLSGLPSPPLATFDNDGQIPPVNAASQGLSSPEVIQSDMDSLTALISAHQISSGIDSQAAGYVPADISTGLPLRRSKSQKRSSHFSESSSPVRERLDGKLRLQTLELERVPLSVSVLQRAFDWTVLTSLTLLDCPQYDRLWSMLRRHFQPTPAGAGAPPGKQGSSASLQYHLNLKRIHTDAACPSLITFLKETLAPNTLEVLFLQDRRRTATSNITIDSIYRGPLKRHRGSLKKLMIDSSDRVPKHPTSNSESSRWRLWMPTREVLNFITSGRMSSLRELSIAIDYKDWHHFLQRLPQIPHIRSLNIPFVADYATPAFDPRELAMQVVDVIVLRPEIELCYMGVAHKCFEILENRPHEDSHGATDTHSSAANGGPGGAVTDEEDDEEDDEEGSDEEEDDEDDDGTAIAQAGIDPDETESEMSDHDDSDTDSYDGSEDGRTKPRLRLREILFYDDKVAIFKARHGKL
ncbi:F-box domain-containing protein [Phlyctema vagabunda]|uniref:F-box domain-containing protein n=1 Tax=Phlyctema vagabunda TaxID=108571 RepID=A0ABR4PPL2_9HELO